MKSRTVVFAALGLAGLLPATTIHGQQNRRYRFELRTAMVQDLSVLGQGEQKQDFALTGQVSVTSADSAGGQAVSVKVDSLQASTGSPLPESMIAGLIGSSWTGFRGADGRVKELKTPTDLPGSQLVEGALQQLFPPLPAGTGAGKSWTDTTDTNQEGVSIRTVTNFVTTDSSHAGKKAIRLAGASSSAISGTQESPQGSLNIEGTGNGTIAWLVSPSRDLLAGTFSQDQQLAVTVPSLPAPIPLKVHNEGTSSLLP